MISGGALEVPAVMALVWTAESGSASHPVLGAGGYDTFGINQYLYYTISQKLRAGGRLEWWKADGTSYYEITGGFNIIPVANLLIRPEIRHQWAPGTNDANPFGIPINQTIFGVDAILTF